MYCPEEADHIASDEKNPDYISRQMVLELIGCMPINPTAEEMDELYENVKMIDAAGVRSVVYCKECKNWFDNGTDYCSCDRDALIRHRNFFCAGGERREGGTP